MKNFLLTLWGKMNGWKSIVGYLIAQFAGSQPLLMVAWQAFLANPHDHQAQLNLLGQGILAGGLLHRAIKNVVNMARGK